MLLRRVKKATLTAFEMHPQACLQDDFAWRVNMPAPMILLLPFLILGEKEVPRRGMSGKEGHRGHSPMKRSLGEKSCNSLPAETAVEIKR